MIHQRRIGQSPLRRLSYASYGGNLLCRLGEVVYATFPADDHWEYMNYANSLKWPANPAKTYVLLYWPIFEVHWLSENRWINPVVPATARLHASLEYIDTHVSRYSRFARAYELDIASSQEIVILPTSKREIKLRPKSQWHMPPPPPAGLSNRTLLRKRAIRL